MKSDTAAQIGPLLRAPLLSPELHFDADQQKVLDHSQGTLIVLGGPGTGKTTLAAECAVQKIRNAADPLKTTDSILLLTFGRERASELRDQIAIRTSTTMKEPIARTFHSLAFSILHMSSDSGTPDVLLMSGPEQEFAIREVLDFHIAQAAQDPSREYWPPELAKALQTRGFVRELRDLIMRASERGLSPAQLHAIAEKSGEKYWSAASIFWERYLGGLALEGSSAVDSKMRIDPSEIIMEAVSRLDDESSPTSIAQVLRSRFTTIIVDEFQESDPAQRLLLKKLRGNHLIIFGDGDSAVGRFRGSDPDTLRAEFNELAQSGDCQEVILRHSYRNKSLILDLTKEISDQFRSVAVQRNRIPVIDGGSAQSARLRSESEQAQFIAYQFRKAHLIDGIPWAEMAVIVRAPGATAQAIRRAFAHNGIPVSNPNEALTSNSAIAPLLLLARMATSSAPLSINDCQKLLLSEFGGADAISLRRIRRALLAEQESRSGDEYEGKKFTSAELIIRAIDSGEVTIDGGEPLIRIAGLFEKARIANKSQSAQAEDVLWAIWNNATTDTGEKLSAIWQRTAVRGGNRGAMADRDLDAMMQLFDAARRHSERFPYSRPSAFIEEILRSEILGDVITTKGQRPDVVEILTVHSAKGREWDLVAVAGLQDGAWPNLRQRGSLFRERAVGRDAPPWCLCTARTRGTCRKWLGTR
jgi:superfamily I DNA/RNA helicase